MTQSFIIYLQFYENWITGVESGSRKIYQSECPSTTHCGWFSSSASAHDLEIILTSFQWTVNHKVTSGNEMLFIT